MNNEVRMANVFVILESDRHFGLMAWLVKNNLKVIMNLTWSRLRRS